MVYVSSIYTPSHGMLTFFKRITANIYPKLYSVNILKSNTVVEACHESGHIKHKSFVG